MSQCSNLTLHLKREGRRGGREEGRRKGGGEKE
jgi:hypothetical protein